MIKISLFVPLLFLVIGCGKPEPTSAPEPKRETAKTAPEEKPAATAKLEIRYYAFAG